ncbi:hypothetical protein HZS_4997 [Henneguya salminicola]|uniref:H(+)/Cl(-) exchange transporter 3 (Trinotate prediction) n=1 Tax=Henneguya salminicola TaxID=69463 RepID=A0A6G3MGF4_HENSL|nr:hypothetical protein HZS_4997 [Henneguya salminicola]
MFDELAMDLFDEESLEFYPEIEFSGPNQIKSPEMEDYFLDREKTFKSKYDDFQTIDWLKEKIYSRSRSLNYADTFKYGTYSTKIKILWEEYSVTILLLLIGIVGAFTAFIVSVGVHYFSDIREGYCSYNLLLNQQECCWKYSYDQVKCDQWKLWSDLFNFKINSIESYIINYIFYVLMSVTLSSLSCYLVLNLAPYAAGGGISEIKIILSGFVMRGFLGFGTYTIKTIALILSASSGLMLGQEGPMVHIVCCISNLFIRLFPRFRNNEADKREILVAGSAAGVALSFNAPITGVLFSLEEVLLYF